MEDLQIVDRMMSGQISEEDMLLEAGISFDQLDEIMQGHGKERCVQCGNWWNRDDMDADYFCPECSENS